MNNRSLRKSLLDFKRHPWLHVVTVLTISTALVIMGGFFLCYRNLEVVAEKTNPVVTGTVYLKEGLAPVDLQSLIAKIKQLENVASVTFKEKKQVVTELYAFMGHGLREGLPGSELFPDVLEVDLRREAGNASAAVLHRTISNLPGVAEVDFSEDWLQQYHKVRTILKVLGVVLVLAMVLGCSFIVANFMGIRSHYRKNEIDIMRLFGAQRNFVLTPFLWEAIIEGVLGACAALILLMGFKWMIGFLISGKWTAALGLQSWLYLSASQIVLIVLMGVTMALLGSLTVFLRFKESNVR